MKKLSEYKDEEAIEVLADIIDPIGTIAQDAKFMDDLRNNFKIGKERPRLISYALREHKHEIFCILAALERVPVDEYHCNMMTLPGQILNMLNDKDLMQYFFSSAWTDGETISGPATANIVGDGQ